MRRVFAAVLLSAWLVLACALAGAEPKVTVTSTVPRETIGLTIYNPAVSLVQERRVISLNKGPNEFRMNWAGVQVNRSSARLELSDGEKDDAVRDTVLPQNDPNTVIWHLEAKRSGSFPVSISYYAGGFSWNADYIMTVDDQEKNLTLRAYANVTNSSGENYAEAALRLVMGDVRLVSVGVGRDMAVMGAQRAANAAVAGLAEMEQNLPFGREGFAEYTFYTLARPESLDTGDTKRIPLAASTTIPVRKVYIYDPNLYDGNVAMQYWFDNKKEYNLGPLPPGLLRAYRQETDGRLSLLGEDNLSYVPLDETAKIYLGNARNIIVESVQTDYSRSDEKFIPAAPNVAGQWSYVEEAGFKVTVRNRKAYAVELVLRQYIPNDATLVSADPKPDRPKLGTLEWKLQIPAGETKELVYRTRSTVYRQAPGPVG